MTDLPSRLSAALEGRYTLDRELGAGGMATVYLAHDVRHHRAVALKVLKPELAAVMGGERFLTEIRTTANLQHPHILPLYDSGEADSFLFYVMPYVEGETLRDRLAREKQLSVDETLRIAKAVGGALDFAHRKGVVHRDIKPANILLQDGQPLVADFGIALAVAQAGGGRLTETGLSLGTPHYMSPEQATADRDPDARSDVYSLACVVYEMLTGEPPHLGASAQAVLARILTETARPVRDTRPTVPAHVDATLTKALQKLPADRFDTAADFLAALEGRILVEGTATAAMTGTGPARVMGGSGVAGAPRRPWLLPSVAAGAVVVGAAAGWLARAPKAAPPPSVVRLYIEGDSTWQVTNACCGPSEAISQDGGRIVFMARVGSGRAFYRRDLDDVDGHAVPGTANGYTPFLDPSGRWLGFVADDRLMKVDMSAGTPIALASLGTSRLWGATWSDDGFIYFTPQWNGAPGIYRISDQGGTPTLVSTPDTMTEENRVSPAALPGGRGLLYVSWPKQGGDRSAWVEALDLKDGSSHRLTQGIQAYYADGHLVYALADGSIMARPFDLGSLEVTGDAVRIASNAVTHNASDTEYAVSRSGTVVIRSGGTATESAGDADIGKSGTLANMRLFPIAGPPPLMIVESPTARGMPSFSPDGKRLAFVQARDANVTTTDIWVLELATGLTTRISTEDGYAQAPVWSGDGRSLRWVQAGGSQSGRHLLTRPADLSGPTVPFAPDVTPHLKGLNLGGRLGLSSRSGGPIPFNVTGARPGDADLWIMDADGTNPRPFLQSPASERDGAVSPSGKWIAYTSDETGQDEVWAEPFPEGGPRSRLSEHGGRYPVWVSDTQIAFVAGNAVDVADLTVTGGQARATGLHEVTNSVSNDWGTRPLAASPDGKTLMILGVTVSGRLLVETNRVQQIRARPAGASGSR